MGVLFISATYINKRLNILASCMYIFCQSDCVPICQINENTLEMRRNLKDNLCSKEDLFKSGFSKHDKVSVTYWGNIFSV
jgi:hypothetical protein